MKKFLLIFAILPTFAYASDESIDCNKKPDGSVKCSVKEDGLIVDAITINGGACAVPSSDKILHHAYNSGDKFSVPIKSEGGIPGLSACSYVSSVKVQTHDGKTKTFAPL